MEAEAKRKEEEAKVAECVLGLRLILGELC